jgi:hypothetical protein
MLTYETGDNLPDISPGSHYVIVFTTFTGYAPVQKKLHFKTDELH